MFFLHIVSCRKLQSGLRSTCCVLWHPLLADSNWGRSTQLLLPVHLVRKQAVEEWGMFCSSASCRTRRLHRKISSGISGKKSCSCGERGGGPLLLPPWRLAGQHLHCKACEALEMAMFDIRTCCRLIVPDAMCCIRTWGVLLRQDISDKTGGLEQTVISTLQLRAGCTW